MSRVFLIFFFFKPGIRILEENFRGIVAEKLAEESYVKKISSTEHILGVTKSDKRASPMPN